MATTHTATTDRSVGAASVATLDWGSIGEELDALAVKTSKQLRRLREDRFLAMGEPHKGRKAKD